MTASWRTLSSRYPEATLIRLVEEYADVFDAMDEALTRAQHWEPSPSEYESLGKVKVRRLDGSEEVEDLIVCRVPVVPVRIPNTVRLCIGLLQFDQWRHRDPGHWAAQSIGASLPYANVLLKRKLRPTLDEAADLAAFLMTQTYREDREDYGDLSAPILNLIERNFTPPVPEPLAGVLRESTRRVAVARENYVTSPKLWRGRPQTKRFEKWTQRLTRLTGD